MTAHPSREQRKKGLQGSRASFGLGGGLPFADFVQQQRRDTASSVVGGLQPVTVCWIDGGGNNEWGSSQAPEKGFSSPFGLASLLPPDLPALGPGSTQSRSPAQLSFTD